MYSESDALWAQPNVRVDALRLGEETRCIAFGSWFKPRVALVLWHDLVVAARALVGSGFQVLDVHLCRFDGVAVVCCSSSGCRQCRQT